MSTGNLVGFVCQFCTRGNPAALLSLCSFLLSSSSLRLPRNLVVARLYFFLCVSSLISLWRIEKLLCVSSMFGMVVSFSAVVPPPSFYLPLVFHLLSFCYSNCSISRMSRGFDGARTVPPPSFHPLFLPACPGSMIRPFVYPKRL